MSASLLQVRGLSVEYRGRRRVQALSEVDLELREGHSLGIVGESGCGKSTLARAILGLVRPSAGEVRWRNWSMDYRDRSRMRELRRELQVVFQDPFGSLDPRMTAGASVAEALESLEGTTGRAATRDRVAAALDEVGLDPALAARYPHELSGGQCQRVAIARATIVRPHLLICDEAVSALDVSVQAQIVNLLHDLSERHRMALLFISHNLAVVRHLCDEVAVLYLGRVVELATRDELFAAPRHPYTQALLVSVPEPDPIRAQRPAAAVTGEEGAPVPQSDGRGCDFHPRCPLASTRCREQRPALEKVAGEHVVACHCWRDATPPA